jgi:hypothetical protein
MYTANAYKKGRAFGQAKDAFIKVAELQAGADSYVLSYELHQYRDLP